MLTPKKKYKEKGQKILPNPTKHPYKIKKR